MGDAVTDTSITSNPNRTNRRTIRSPLIFPDRTCVDQQAAGNEPCDPSGRTWLNDKRGSLCQALRAGEGVRWVASVNAEFTTDIRVGPLASERPPIRAIATLSGQFA